MSHARASRFQEVADRIWVARYPWFDVNVTLVAGDRGLLVVDTHASGAAAAEVIEDVRLLGAGEVVAVVNTHEHFDHTYAATWWPGRLPTLIVSGGEDRIVTQRLWDDERYRGPNVIRREVAGGAHFPWIERPDAVRDAFAAFAQAVAGA